MRDSESPTSEQAGGSARTQATVLRFSELGDPFSQYGGDPNRMVKALFDAACVWGREHRVERREDETPEEFVARLGRKYSPIAESLVRLGMLYSRLAYAQKRVQPGDALALRTLWDWMVAHPPHSGTPNVILNRDPMAGSV